MTIDITSPRTFTVAAILCILFGGIMGSMCSVLFYAVSHIQIAVAGAQPGNYTATQIDPVWGAVFILIMAATAFCIALTFRLVPGWVARYYETREIPPFVEWIRKLVETIKHIFGEEE